MTRFSGPSLPNGVQAHGAFFVSTTVRPQIPWIHLRAPLPYSRRLDPITYNQHLRIRPNTFIDTANGSALGNRPVPEHSGHIPVPPQSPHLGSDELNTVFIPVPLHRQQLAPPIHLLQIVRFTIHLPQTSVFALHALTLKS